MKTGTHSATATGLNVDPRFHGDDRLTVCVAAGGLRQLGRQAVDDFLAIAVQFLHRFEGAIEQQRHVVQDAVDHLQLAIKIGPPQATAYGDLSEALAKLGRSEEALPMLQQAIELDPFNPVLQKTLVLRYIQEKQYPSARAALEHYLEIFPQDSFMRHLLDMASKGSAPQ